MCAPPSSISGELCSVPRQIFWRWWWLILFTMSRHSPSLGASQQSASVYFSIDPCSLVEQGVPPCRRHHQTPCSAQTGTTNYDLFSPLLLIVTFQEMTIKHLMYTPKVPFLYTERACVLFSRFWNLPRKFFMLSVATVSDQREYMIFSDG